MKYLIVGLGNPGREYAQTRHNVGFQVVDELAQRHKLPTYKSERKALTTAGIINGQSVIIAKPQTYMNLSGEAVRALLDYYKIEIAHFIVAHDDLDLPLGTLRLRQSGGHGGQNGVRSIITQLGTQDFARVRFGIGRPPGKMQPRDYVLHKFTSDDAILAQQVTAAAVNAIEYWLEAGIELAMSKFNSDINQASNEAQAKPDVPAQLQLAERAHELSPTDPKPLEEMIRLYKRLNRLDGAARAYLQLAEIYSASGDSRQMVNQWEQAVRIRPMLIEVREAIARAYETDDNLKKAVQTWLALAEYHTGQGDMAAALRAIGEAMRINPQHPRALEMQSAVQKKLMM